MSDGGVFGRFRLGGNDDDLDSTLVTKTRQALSGLAARLEDERFGYEDRQAIATAIEDLLREAAQVTAARIEYVPAENDPSTGELADAVAQLAGGITDDYLVDGASNEMLMALQSAVDDIHALIEETHDFPYAFQEKTVNTVHQKALQSVGKRTDIDSDDATEVYAGPYARQQLERPSENPDDPLWLGTGTRNGKDASIPKKYLFRHCAVFGPTGYGKTTAFANSFLQLIRAGYGGCFIDPKGDDSKKLMERIPDDRLDDVIWIEPGSSREYVSGFNFISLGLEPGHDLYETALTNLVDDLAVMVGADEWPRMKRVARNLVRAMNMYNRDHPDEPDLNLIDLYYILASEASRHEFAARARAAGLDFVHEYTEMIAEMDDSDLEPLLGRFQPLVEDPLARRMIGFRDADINIPEAIENDKIIIVRMSDESDRLKTDLGMAIVRRIWATVRSRAVQSEFDRDPYFLFIDEFDDVAERDGSITTMLSESRSYRLSLFFACQFPGQLPDEITEAMFVNADTILAFNPGSKKQARPVAAQLDMDKQTLLNESNYHIWMQMNVSDTMEKSPAFRVYTHPPYPPLRTREDANDLILESLRRHGRERKSTTERKQELLFYEGQGQLETGYGEQLARAEDPEVKEMYRQDLLTAVKADERGEDPPDATSQPSTSDADSDEATGDDPADQLLDTELETVLEAIFAARVRAQEPPGALVDLDPVEREAEYRLGDLGYLSKFANVIERLPDDLVTRDRIGGNVKVGLTAAGRARVVEQDTGESGSGGGAAHRYVLAKSYATFTRLGYLTWLPTQEGDEDPDGVAETPINPMEDADSLEEAKALEEQLQREAPGVYALSGTRDVAIEAETSTPKKPCQPIQNLRKAVDTNQLCVFACKDGTANKDRFDYWAHLVEQKFHTTFHDGQQHAIDWDTWTLAQDVDDDGNRTFYNRRLPYRLDEHVYALRPHGDSGKHITWREDGDEVVVEDTEVGEIGRFDSLDAVKDGDRSALPYYEYDIDEEVYYVYHDGQRYTYNTEEELLSDYSKLKAPYVPEHHFDTPLEEVGPDSFITIIYPDADNDVYDRPQVYDQGELVPLSEYLDVDITPPAVGDLDSDNHGDGAGTPRPSRTITKPLTEASIDEELQATVDQLSSDARLDIADRRGNGETVNLREYGAEVDVLLEPIEQDPFANSDHPDFTDTAEKDSSTSRPPKEGSSQVDTPDQPSDTSTEDLEDQPSPASQPADQQPDSNRENSRTAPTSSSEGETPEPSTAADSDRAGAPNTAEENPQDSSEQSNETPEDDSDEEQDSNEEDDTVLDADELFGHYQ